jgi:hypothetical protein
MGNTPPIWWPVGGRALQPLQPEVVHQPDPVRDTVGVSAERPCTGSSVVLNAPWPTAPGAHDNEVPQTEPRIVKMFEDLRAVQECTTPEMDTPMLEGVAAPRRDRPMQKLSRTMMRSFVARHLKTKQDGLCPLCKKPIDLTVKGEGVLDHDHDSGEIRGVLHRSCNAAEGKIANAAARWGAKSSAYSAIILYLQNLVSYLTAPGAGLIYPMHKTADEKRDDKNAKVRAQRALTKAKLALRSTKGVA